MTRAPASAICPRCGAWARMLPIVFGLPTHETFEAADRGDVVLGGCLLSGEDPTHRCAACGRDVILDRDPPLPRGDAGEPGTDESSSG